MSPMPNDYLISIISIMSYSETECDGKMMWSSDTSYQPVSLEWFMYAISCKAYILSAV